MVALLIVGLGICAVVLLRGAHHAQQVVGRLRGDAAVLQEQAKDFDLTGAASTMARLRAEADDAHDTTRGPLWAAATWIPVLGDDVGAARDVSASVAGILDTAQPLEAALPRLDPKRGKGRFDVAAIADVARALPNLSTAVDKADATVAAIDPSGLQPQLADGVRTLHKQLAAVQEPLANAVPAFRILPSMLGQDRTKNWLVLLQQDAEARGTGGVVGAFAVVKTNHGKITLAGAAQRDTIAWRKIPSTAVPQELNDLWGKDLTEWAGLNLSPHFPWTGQLVSAGWAAKKGAHVDYVAAIDQYAVAGLLAGTGPVKIGRDVITSQNAVSYLSSRVYQRHPDYHDVDIITGQLVAQTFARVASGKVDLPSMVKAIAEQSGNRHILAWSADADEQRELETLSVGGALPATPGPFAMAVINNGGGNKLDAYLKVHIGYDPGRCIQGTRIGALAVKLTNTAPAKELTYYQSVRADLLDDGVNALDEGQQPHPARPLRSAALEGAAHHARRRRAGPDVERHRPRPLGLAYRRADPPGQQREVRAVILQPVDDGEGDGQPQVMLQPMAIPQTATVRSVAPCSPDPVRRSPEPDTGASTHLETPPAVRLSIKCSA